MEYFLFQLIQIQLQTFLKIFIKCIHLNEHYSIHEYLIPEKEPKQLYLFQCNEYRICVLHMLLPQLSNTGKGWYLTLDTLALYMTTALIMPTAARRHPAMNTRFRFRFVTGEKRKQFELDLVQSLTGTQTRQVCCRERLPVFIPGLSARSADLFKRRGPWEMRCLEVWEMASLFRR